MEVEAETEASEGMKRTVEAATAAGALDTPRKFSSRHDRQIELSTSLSLCKRRVCVFVHARAGP